MAQNTTANQHYIPQCYLNSFTYEKEKCYVFDKSNKKYFKPNVRNIMSQRYFYDFNYKQYKEQLDNETGKDNLIPDKQINEKILSEIEGYFSNIISNIISNFIWFSNKCHNWFQVYKFIAIQMMRTPQGKKMIFNIYKELIFDIKEDLENIFFAKELIDTIQCERIPIVLEYLLQEYGHLCIGINNNDIPFITSDNPVMVLPSINNKDNTIIYYPVTPSRCILLYPRKKADAKLNEVLDEISKGIYKISHLWDIPQEAYRRENKLREKLNPLTNELNEMAVVSFNSYCYKNANRLIISNVDLENENFFKAVMELNN